MSEVSTKNYDIIRKKLVKKEDAMRLSVTFLPLVKTRELTIYWPVRDDKMMQECLRLLDEQGSSTGKKGDTWVDDPYASNEVYPGRWRIIANRMAAVDEAPGVYQVLREGLLRTLPATEAADTEVRLIRDAVDPQNGSRKIVRFWQGIDPSYNVAMITAREAVKLRTDIMVRGQTITGTFAVSNVYAEPMDGDGAVRIVEELTEVAVVEDSTDLQGIAPILQQENEILELFGWETGEGDYITATYTNLAPSSREAIMQISDADMVTAITSAEGIVTPQGLSYADRKFNELKDNTAQLVVLLKKATWTNAVVVDTLGTRRNIVAKSNPTGLDIRRQDIAQGIPIANMTDAALASIVAETGYVVDSVQAKDNGNGSGTLSRAQTKINSRSTNYAHIWVPGIGAQEEAETVIWKNISTEDKDAIITECKANKTNMAANVVPLAPAGHQLRRITDTDNGNGTWNVVRVTSIPSSGPASDWTDTASPKSYFFITAKFRKDANNMSIRRFLFHVFTANVYSKTNAYAYINQSENMFDINVPQGGLPYTSYAASASTSPVKASVSYAGKGRWIAVKMYCSCTGWDNEVTGALASDGQFKDLGGGIFSP